MKKIITTIAFGLLSVTMNAQVPSYVPTNGLVGYWPFTNNANDQSINANNGIVSAATLTTDRFGNNNSAYSFNGISNYISVPSNTTMSGFNNLTISSWVYINQFSGVQNLVTKWFYTLNCGGNTDNYATAISNNTIVVATNNNNLSGYAVPTALTIEDLNVWKHIVFVSNATSGLSVYVNGVLTASSPLIGSICNSTNPLYFGAANSTLRFFKGKLDDIGIWNRVLTQQEITGLYNANLCYQNITVTDTLLINTTITGFNPVIYKNTIKVWPNPTHDHITIDNGNLANVTGYQIKITNSLAQQVFQSAITQQQFYVDLSTWTGNGIYFVHIIDALGNTIDIKKIVLQ